MGCREDLRARGGWRGEHRDVLLGPDGDVIWEREWGHNVLVDTARSLLATLVKGDATSGRVAFWAVGAGDPAWDLNPPPPDGVRLSWTKLEKEVARKQIQAGQITFVGGTANKSLEIQSTFVAADFGGQVPLPMLREFGLFSAGPQILMINHRVHPAIGMQTGFTLQRTLRLTF